MLLPFDVINYIISFLKPRYIYDLKILNKYYSNYIMNKNHFNFSKIKGYDLIYAIKRNNIKLIDWLLQYKMYHKKILTFAIVYSNRQTILFVLNKSKIYKIRNSNIILAKQREDDPEIYSILINYYKSYKVTK